LEEGCVFAFEPNPNCFGYLKQNIALNQGLRIHAFEMAISDKVGKAKLSFGGVYDRSARLGSEEEWDLKDVVTCSVDEFVRAHPFPTILKIDVEGAENLVINGALNSLENDSLRAILLELHPTMLSGQEETASELRCIVKACGFVEVLVKSRRDQMHILFEKPCC
jgi:FkbM family methyltransferase